jgi:protein-S-isoprenylcysteine O-methyltransferase Ste14
MGFGMALMCHSGIMAILLILVCILQHFIILEEEAFCMRRYGESYKTFKERVPRYLLFF